MKLVFPPDICKSTRILKRIPRAARHQADSKLARLLDDVTARNDILSWARLFKFGRRCLVQPQRGGQRRNLSTLVKRQVDKEADPSSTTFPHRPTLSDPIHSLAKRVSAKLEEGDYRGAVRIACSEESIADITEETITLLKEKHPAPHSESSIPNPHNQTTCILCQ